MRAMKLLGSVAVLLACQFGSAVCSAQTVPVNAVPFVSEVTPPSLPPGSVPTNPSSFTLTILGANFTPNVVVNLAGSPSYILHPSSMTVSPSGSRITAQFTNVVLGSPGTFAVTVTNPAGTQPSTSNVYYLPYTPAQPSVVLSQNSTSFLTGSPKGMATADFFGNGDPSLAVVSQNSNTVSILRSNYSGPLTLSSSNPTGNQPWAIVAADFLGAGQPSLAITNSADNTITILYPNGGGTYRLGTTISLPGVFPTALVAADLNGDGKIDLAVLNTCGPGPGVCFPQAAPQGPGSVTILLNNGDGTFTVSPATLTTGNVPFAMAAADLNEDGVIDLVVANQNSNNLTIFMGNGDGTFTPAASSPATGNAPSAIAIGDFNGDGHLDLAITNSTDNTVSILLNQNCSSVAPTLCTFAPAPVSPAVGAGPSAISTADMNADGFLDLVVANASDSTVSILLGDGTGNFNPVVPLQGQPNFSTGTSPQALVLADFNQDGRLDIVTSNSSGSFSYLRQAAVGQLTLTANNPSTSYGFAPTFTANLIPPFGQSTPTGTITFLDGNTPIGTVTLNGYQGYFQYAGLNAGTHQITAVYSGDSNFVSITSNAVSEVVAQSSTTTGLSSNVTTVPYGLPFTLTAAISVPGTNPATNPATGTIKFFDTTTSTDLGDVSPVVNQAQLTLSNLAAGTHVVVATYSGDSNFNGSSSANLTETVVQATTTTVLSTNPSPAQFAQNVTLTATVQPPGAGTTTGTVTFYDGSTSLGSATLSSNSAVLSVSTLSVGSHTLSAKYSGDTNFLSSSSGTATESVNQGATTTVVSANAVPPVYFGQYVTFTAQVTPAYGSLTLGQVTSMSFYDGTTLLGTQTTTSNTAGLAVQSLTAGTHTITAQWSGTANYAASTSSPVTQTILQVPSTASVYAVINPSAYGQGGYITAAVDTAYHFTGSGGTFTLFDNGSSIATGSMQQGTAFFPLSLLTAGTHSLTVNYGGDANLAASTSTAFTQTVNKAATTTAVSSSTNFVTLGQSVTFTVNLTPASGSAPTGTVVFLDGTIALGSATVSNNSAQFTAPNLSVGTHSITAQYSGDANFAGSTSAVLGETVNPGSVTITLSSGSNPSIYGQAVTFTANVQPVSTTTTPTGTVSFMQSPATLGTVPLSNGSAQLVISTLPGGQDFITAKYSGDSNFQPSTFVLVIQNISPASTSTTVTSSQNPSPYSQSVTFTASVQPAYGGSASGSVTFYDGATSLGSVTPTNNSAQLTFSSLSGGSHAITARYAGDYNTNASVSPVFSQSVTPVPTTTTVTSSVNPSGYGQTVTFVASFSPAASGVAGGTLAFYDGSTILSAFGINAAPPQVVLSNLTTGTHSITAVFTPVSSNYAASTSSPVTQTVNQAATTTTIGTSSNPSSFGQNMTVTVSVSSAYHLSSSGGTVTLFDNGNSIASAIIQGSGVGFSVPNLGTGSHSLTATYSGDSNLIGSTSAPFTQTVNPGATSLALALNSYATTYGQSVTMTSNVTGAFGGSPTGSITFLDGSTALGTATMTKDSAQFAISTLVPANHSITAKYNGDANFAGNTSGQATLVVSQATTTTSAAADVNPATYGQTVTLSASVQIGSGTGPTGSITFLDGSTTLGTVTLANGSAQLVVSTLGGGSHSITAKYSGDTNFAASTSGTLAETVNAAASSTALTSSSGTATVGQTITFTATVQPSVGSTASGTVTFYDGTTTMGTATLASNSAQLTVSTLTLGTHSIAATYGGNGNLAGSSSAAVVETITQASTTVTFTSSLNPAPFGQAVQFSGTVQTPSGGAATGTVTFFDGTTSLGTATVTNNGIQHNSVTLYYSGFTGGTHTITAGYSGDANYAASTSAPLTETVTQASSTVSIASGLNPATFGQIVTLTATVQPSISGDFAGGTVIFYEGATALGTVSLSSEVVQLSLSNLAAGSHSITAKYSGDGNFAGSTSSVLAEAINQGSTTVTVAPSANPSAFGQAITLSATIQPGFGGNATGTITFLDGAISIGTSSVSGNAAQLSISSLAVGSHSITAKYSGDANFSASTSSAFSQTINQASTTATVTSSVNPAAFGQSVIFTVKVQSSSSGAPTGTVRLLDGATSLGSSSLPSNGIAQFTLNSFSLGSHSITATYSGDANFSGSASAALAQVVNQASTTTSLSSSANPSSYGQAVTFTASVVPSFGGAPTGTVTFLDGGVQIGTATVSANVASLTTGATALSTRSHSITASYSGDANIGGSSSAALSQVVNGAATSTTLVSSLDPSVAGQSVNFTATVSSTVSGTQSGTVSFYLDGSTTPAQSSAISGGTATFSTNTLSGGSHTVTAAFVSTNANFQGSSSALLTQNVKDFSISPSPASLTIYRSHSGTTTLTVAPIAGFSGNVSLSCSGAPTNTTCSVSPSQVSLNGTNSAQATATIKTGSHAPVGTYSLTLKGTSGSATHSITVSLTIN